MVPGRAFVLHLAREPGQSLPQHGEAEASESPLRLGQPVLARRIAEPRGQIELILLQHIDAEGAALLQQPN